MPISLDQRLTVVGGRRLRFVEDNWHTGACGGGTCCFAILESGVSRNVIACARPRAVEAPCMTGRTDGRMGYWKEAP